MIVYLKEQDIEVNVQSFSVNFLSLNAVSRKVTASINLTDTEGNEYELNGIYDMSNEVLSGLNGLTETFLEGIGGRPNDRSRR